MSRFHRRSLLAATLAITALAGSVAMTEADQSAPTKQQQVKAVQAQQGTSNCRRQIKVPEYRTNAHRIYHQKGRVWPKQIYRLLHMRVCAVDDQARLAMNKITIRQRQARIKRKARARARALRTCGTPSCNRRMGQYMAAKQGITGSQWSCLDSLWGKHESGWDETADNPNSSAYGIPQALPGYKMGPGWQSNVRVQIRWGLSYVRGRYGSACSALSARIAQGWY